VNLPEKSKGRWGEGLTAADMEKCRWLRPQLVGAIEFVQWTQENRVRHPKFVCLRDDKEGEQVIREGSRQLIGSIRVRPLPAG
jgi:bifunctional non-homologous end joining protein LigD